MRTKSRALIQLVLILLVGAVMVPGAQAQTTVEVSYQWTAPTSGSPVDHYVIEHSVNGGPFVQVGTSATAEYTLTATIGDSHVIRVAGVDDQDRTGVFSEPSDPYIPDAGPPGQPGKPQIL